MRMYRMITSSHVYKDLQVNEIGMSLSLWS